MNTIIHNIDSSFINKNESNTKFKYVLDAPIKNIIKIKISSIDIPSSIYTIQNERKNNFFEIVQNDNVEKIIIPDGNYTNESLKNLINKKISIISLQYNSNIEKFTFVSTDNFKLNFQKNSSYKSLGEIMGFKNTEYSNNNSYTSENIANLTDFTYCFLKINDIGNVHHLDKKYIAKIIIPNDKYNNSHINENKFVSKNVTLKQPINLSIFHIELVDPLGNLLDLNGVPFNLTIEFKVINNSLLKNYSELTFYDEELMDIIVNDTLLQYYSNKNNSNNIGETYENFLKSNVPNLTVEVDDIKSQIDKINVRLDNDEEMKKIELEDMKKREMRRKEKYIKKKEKIRLANKMTY